jgi:hypothetical protein
MGCHCGGVGARDQPGGEGGSVVKNQERLEARRVALPAGKEDTGLWWRGSEERHRAHSGCSALQVPGYGLLAL